MPRHYITTAIDYPNAAPHMGHVLEKVLADVLARWYRLRGDSVRFQIGTDEHGIKIQRAAEVAGEKPEEFVAKNRAVFIELYTRLGISFDEPFMHTSGNAMHAKVVQEVWKRLAAARREDGSAVLEKRAYTALYCSGCERFITKKELVDGKCPDHQKAPEEVTEQNWFFSLSKDTDFLKKLLHTSYRIIPDFRAPETLMLLENGLEDVSFSRPVSSLSWGIPVPGDDEQTMYVWCDALTNYISGLHFFDTNEMASHAKLPASGKMASHAKLPAGSEVWWNDATVTHVIGKDIARFHALIWPAMLHHAGIKTPDRLLIHGFLTSEGQKMSKSLGNVVVPQDVIEKYGVDALRFYLSHEIPVGNDGDFSWKRFGELYDSGLRNVIGNLLNRVLVMLKKEGAALAIPADITLEDFSFEGKKISGVWQEYADAFAAHEVHRALKAAVHVAGILNVYMQTKQPWKLEGEEKIKILSAFAEHLRHLTLMLLPFIPETAQKMAVQLNLPGAKEMHTKGCVITDDLKQWGGDTDWKQIGEPSILFPPVEMA